MTYFVNFIGHGYQRLHEQAVTLAIGEYQYLCISIYLREPVLGFFFAIFLCLF